MSRPNLQPPEIKTVDELGPRDTGIAAAANTENKVLLFRMIEGDITWIESLHPEEAEHIGQMLIGEAAKARKRRAS